MWQQGLPAFILFPRILVKRQKHLEEKCLPGSAMTLSLSSSFQVGLRAQTVLFDNQPAGKPPPISSMLIQCPYILPISRHFLASFTALPKAEEPCCPEPQWKCIPFNLIPISDIQFILSQIISSFSKSSPNLPEKGVAKLSEASSFMAILQRISIFGAQFLIFINQSIESAVVNFTPVSLAQERSFSFLIGLEQTMLSRDTPAFKLDLISSLEAQSIPAPWLARSLISSMVGFDLMAQCGFIQGRVFFQAESFREASVGLQTKQLELRLSEEMNEEISNC